MKREHLRWICGLIAAVVCLGASGEGLAESPGERAERSGPGGVNQMAVEEAMEPAGGQSFAELFPKGKLSVVERQVSGTAAVLKAAHKAALRGREERGHYREALVYQAASRQALSADRFALSMYLTLHGRALAERVVRANSSDRPPRDHSRNLELIKRAGGIDSEEVDSYVEQASRRVPAANLLFVDGE